MKKQIIITALAISALFNMTAFAENNIDRESAFASAYSEIQENIIDNALSIGIIENKDYSWNEDINREQFCEFAYNMINSVKELPVAKLSANPFNDINNPKINALTFVNIISGKEEGRFAPNDKITREEAAVVLYRMAKYAGIEMPVVKVDMSYSDNDKISDWAVSSVYSLKVLNVITNNTDDRFDPKSNYTVGESISSIIKLYDLIKK